MASNETQPLSIDAAREAARTDPRVQRLDLILGPQLALAFRPGHAREWVRAAAVDAVVRGWGALSYRGTESQVDYMLAYWVREPYRAAWRDRLRRAVDSARGTTTEVEASDA